MCHSTTALDLRVDARGIVTLATGQLLASITEVALPHCLTSFSGWHSWTVEFLLDLTYNGFQCAPLPHLSSLKKIAWFTVRVHASFFGCHWGQ